MHAHAGMHGMKTFFLERAILQHKETAGLKNTLEMLCGKIFRCDDGIVLTRNCVAWRELSKHPWLTSAA